MRWIKRPAMGTGVVFVGLFCLAAFAFMLPFIGSWYNGYSQGKVYVGGVFHGLTVTSQAELFGSQTVWIVKLNGTYLSCYSSYMGNDDIYNLTHLQNGTDITMTKDCTNMMVMGQ